ncbi:hypothetical protein [Streptomyces sp. ODS05-4]|uniref:hypothetical protein n=1 Tax=Streptomyces sp. ODS05-4 TaxID=2944939 RepID=UPI00210DC396|nr:hypothetical protein [Streptomyces sp. ODS05-4]
MGVRGRGARRALAAAVAAGALAVAGCGTERAAQDGPPAAGAAGAGTAAPPAADPLAAGRAAHDRAFPGVARRCAGTPVTAPPDPSPSGSVSLDPEAAKYAENHAFKRQRPMRPDAECRGRAHAERIAEALSGPAGKAAAGGEEPLKAALAALGYPEQSVRVYPDGPGLAFSVFVPDAGPCVSGRPGPPARAEAHGPYEEGGCVEPVGGH